jgi:tetratricopeptide (TPR) repeat protein
MDAGDRQENTISGGVSGLSIQTGSVHGNVHVHAGQPQPRTPRQLLLVSASFTDRERELMELSTLLTRDRRSGPAMAVVAGPGGVGKTSLASRWIADHVEQFPDGQLHADLGAFSVDGPTAPEEVLGRFLRALGVSAEQVPAGLAEQAALYRSMTADKRIAILADDADSAAQVRPLLPASPQSVVVVTSRWRLGALTMDGAQVLVVNPLNPAAGLTLLQQTVGGQRVTIEPEQARELVELCGGLPIALCVAAARLSTRPRWPISRLVEVLADERSRLSALTVADEAVVQASFDLSFGELTPNAARAYRLLGLHPGRDFGTGVAAAAVDRSPEDTDGALDELVDASLLTDIGPDRFRFHDLTRVHARQQADDDSASTRDETLRRMVTWYLDNVVAADRTVMPLRPRLGPRYQNTSGERGPFNDAEAALRWEEQELANIVAAARAAHERGWLSETWQFCEALWGVFLYRRHYPEWRQTHNWGIDAARRCGNLRAEARLEIQLGYLDLNTDHYDEARERFTASLQIGEHLPDLAVQATAWEHLGVVAQSTGDQPLAAEYFTRALRFAEEQDDRRSVALHLRRLGELAGARGHLLEAAQHLERSAEVSLAIGDHVLHARALTRLGSTHLRAGRVIDAATTLRKAAAIFGDAGAESYLAEALEALAEASVQALDIPEARTFLEQALAIYGRSDDPKSQRVQSRLAALATETMKPTSEPPA